MTDGYWYRDNHQRLCFTLGLWNCKDPILKERLYGLNGNQGNHGEDVKEVYYYLDSTPTHSYMKYLYKYPQAEFPYQQLKDENQNRSMEVGEFELMDTDLFDENRYWDVYVEVSLLLCSSCNLNVANCIENKKYAKDEEFADAISVRITAYNRGPDPANLHILPQLFFRNTWSWGKELPPNMPSLSQEAEGVIHASHDTLGETRLYCTPSPAPAAPAKGGVVLVDGPSIVPDLLFTENETNFEKLWGGKNRTPFVKDAFHDHLIPSHRPPEPEVAKTAGAGLALKSPAVKTPKLPPAHTAAELEQDDDDDEPAAPQKKQADGGHDGPIHAATPPPRPISGHGYRQFVNPDKTGTKAAAHYHFTDVPANGGCVVVRLKLTPYSPDEDPTIVDEELFDENMEERRVDADEFYGRIARGGVSEDLRSIMRQALSGMLW